MNKQIYLIRHGEALHNVLFKVVGNNAYTKFRDTELTIIGKMQAEALGKKWKEKQNIDLILVSPLTRTLETALRIFPNNKKSIIALDSLKEYPQSIQICNQRKDLDELIKTYNKVDFSNLNKNNYWNDYPLQQEIEVNKLKKRISVFKKFIKNRNEKNIAVIGHSSYFNMMLHNIVDDESNELEHCYPYKYTM
tara:strand:- start:2372 stop:2950 length:579 start_codon:yes stop_codon:yes gene_type:complete